MENGQQQKTLLTELVEGLTNDVAEIKQILANQPQATPPLDLRPTLEKVAKAINELRNEVGDLNEQRPQSQAPPVDLTPITQELHTLRQEMRKTPAYQITKAVQYGAGLLLVSLLTTGVLAYYATKWKNERDVFEVSDWKWRAVRQVDAVYADKVDQAFETDSSSQDDKVWIIQQEQADATREAARRAAEQAKAMNAQADKLEGKKKGQK